MHPPDHLAARLAARLAGHPGCYPDPAVRTMPAASLAVPGHLKRPESPQTSPECQKSPAGHPVHRRHWKTADCPAPEPLTDPARQTGYRRPERSAVPSPATVHSVGTGFATGFATGTGIPTGIPTGTGTATATATAIAIAIAMKIDSGCCSVTAAAYSVSLTAAAAERASWASVGSAASGSQRPPVAPVLPDPGRSA